MISMRSRESLSSSSRTKRICPSLSISSSNAMTVLKRLARTRTGSARSRSQSSRLKKPETSFASTSRCSSCSRLSSEASISELWEEMINHYDLLIIRTFIKREKEAAERNKKKI